MSELNKEKLVNSSLNINLKNITELKTSNTSNIEVYTGANKAILMDLNGDQSFTDFIYKTKSIRTAIENYPLICTKLKDYADTCCGQGVAAIVNASEGGWGHNHYWHGTSNRNSFSNALTVPLTGVYTFTCIARRQPVEASDKGGYILYRNNYELYRNFESGVQATLSKGDRLVLRVYNEFYQNTRRGSQYKTNEIDVEVKLTFQMSNFLNSGTGIF